MDFTGTYSLPRLHAHLSSPDPQNIHRMITLFDCGHSIDLLLEEDSAMLITNEHIGQHLEVGPMECVRVFGNALAFINRLEGTMTSAFLDFSTFAGKPRSSIYLR